MMAQHEASGAGREYGVSADDDIRPVVERARRGLSTTAIAILAILAGLLLFGVLEAKRRGASAPATVGQPGDISTSSPMPRLYIPPEPIEPDNTTSALVASRATPVTPATLPASSQRSASLGTLPPQNYSTVAEPSAYATGAAPVEAARRTVSGAALIFDDAGARADAIPPPSDDGENKSTSTAKSPSAGLPTARVRAAMLANRAMTVPQGTLIPAVLETAFDSTHAGFARALVQRDIRGFDGSQVLIPRGSRLIGEYGEDIAQGQRRAIVLWTRLIRPDGVTIAIGSPATDPLGRGGMKADVDTHFFERFSGAILQSAFDLGISLAARSSQSPVVVALPGSVGGVVRAAPQQSQIKPTLRVAAGSRVSIFVARDLDFTGMDRLP